MQLAVEEAGIPNVSPSATAVSLAQNGWKFWHRVLANDDVQGPGAAAQPSTPRPEATAAKPAKESATTLGDLFSEVLYPAISSHRRVSSDERARLGISEGTLRLSVGIEDADDLIADLDAALVRV